MMVWIFLVIVRVENFVCILKVVLIGFFDKLDEWKEERIKSDFIDFGFNNWKDDFLRWGRL